MAAASSFGGGDAIKELAMRSVTIRRTSAPLNVKMIGLPLSGDHCRRCSHLRLPTRLARRRRRHRLHTMMRL